MHTVETLVAKFPWSNHPAILKRVDKFTPEQWELINDSVLKERIDELLTDEELLTIIFDQLSAVMQSAAHSQIVQDSVSFNAFILVLIRQYTLPSSDYRRLKKVELWFGELFSLVEAYCDTTLNSIDTWNLIIELFSDQSITDCLEGKTQQIEPFKGEDARQYLRDNQMTIVELIAHAEQAFEIKGRQLPDWVGTSFVIKKAASQFTDQQLCWLSDCLSPSFLQDTRLISDLLKLFLAETVVNGEQIITRMNHQWNFKQLAIKIENHLLNVVFESGKLIRNLSNKINEPEAHNFIKKYGIEKPLHPDQVSGAFEEAIRKAIEQGNYWEAIEAANNYKIDINALGKDDGKTLLHVAAELANSTQNTLCYELLLQFPNINTSIKDNQGNTANELLTYRAFANPELRKKQTFKARLDAINYKEEIEPSFMCLIGLCIMNDPVALSTGFTYCRESLHKLLLANINPRTGEFPLSLNCPISARAFLSAEIGNPTNINIKQLIDKFVTSQEQAYKQMHNQRITRSSSFGSFFDEKSARNTSEDAIQKSNIM